MKKEMLVSDLKTCAYSNPVAIWLYDNPLKAMFITLIAMCGIFILDSMIASYTWIFLPFILVLPIYSLWRINITLGRRVDGLLCELEAQDIPRDKWRIDTC